jgi:hypothetical protein
MECFPNAKSIILHAIIITQSSWFFPLTFRYGRYFTKMSTATQAMIGEVMEKTRLEQMKLKELPWPANEAERAAMATKAATTQEQQPP